MRAVGVGSNGALRYEMNPRAIHPICAPLRAHFHLACYCLQALAGAPATKPAFTAFLLRAFFSEPIAVLRVRAALIQSLTMLSDVAHYFLLCWHRGTPRRARPRKEFYPRKITVVFRMPFSARNIHAAARVSILNVRVPRNVIECSCPHGRCPAERSSGSGSGSTFPTDFVRLLMVTNSHPTIGSCRP